MALNDKERKELERQASSLSLKDDMNKLAAKAHNPFMVNGRIDADKWINFLNGYNEFINHAPKPFCKIIDRLMKL